MKGILFEECAGGESATEVVVPEGDRMNPFYYLTHLDNLESILQHGILAHDLAEQRGLIKATVYDDAIVERRRKKETPAGCPLTRYANLYVQPRNSMLYRVIQESGVESIALLQIRPDAMKLAGALVTTGNAAADRSEIRPSDQYEAVLKEIETDLTREWWSREDGSMRRMMAECLVPDIVPPAYIQAVLVGKQQVADKVRELLKGRDMPVVVQPYQFFLPTNKQTIATKLALVTGDLFFSHKQTLTVSVNTVGIMGKGLASRAKYQFPDLYVYYQDLCKTKKLRLGRPYFYKPEKSLYVQLADDWSPRHAHTPTQFLLFATKEHWRDASPLAAIVEGLDWLLDNYEAEGVESLAIPALGCGLGRLDWKDVGPAMCSRLAKMKVPVWIYLPAEKKLEKEHLTKDFLLA